MAARVRVPWWILSGIVVVLSGAGMDANSPTQFVEDRGNGSDLVRRLMVITQESLIIGSEVSRCRWNIIMSLIHFCAMAMLFGLVGQVKSTQGPLPVVPAAQQRDGDDERRDRLELGKSLWVCEVQQPGQEPQFYVTLLSPKESFANGILPEAIVGMLKGPVKDGETIKPENFVRNKIFNDFMHEFIARHGPNLKGLQAEARRQGEGWVYVIDARTATPRGKVPLQDILGGFEVKSGRLVTDSYKRNNKHVLLSQEGFFRLPPELQRDLIKELTERNSKLGKQGGGVQGKKD